MKVTGGTARGRSIASPGGSKVRPTSSKVRQAIFNILGERVIDARFLDICAGSGLMGFEALSRGAASLVSIEENKHSARAIERSLELLEMDGEVYAADFRQIIPKLAGNQFDIIFADPPYKTTLPQAVLQAVSGASLLAPDGILLIEHIPSYAPDRELGSLCCSDRRSYGDTHLAFYRHRE